MEYLKNTAAWKLAELAQNLGADFSLFDAALKASSADDIARAYTHCLTDPIYQTRSVPRLVLREYLQLRLMEEHVAAQRRMGRTITWLNWALVVFTLALVWFSYVEYKRHDSVPAPPRPLHFVPDVPQPAAPQ